MINFNNLLNITKTDIPPRAMFGVVNCRSVKNKADYVCDYIIENNTDCIALTETWLGGGDQDRAVINSLVPSGYKIAHKPREDGRGGGVALLYKEHYAFKAENTFKAQSFEFMSALLTIGSFAFRVIVIYRIPPSKQNKLKKTTFLAEFADLLELSATWSGKLLLLGDFNVHWDIPGDSERKQLATLLNTFGLEQQVQDATHVKGHTLDLVICRTTDNLVSSCTVSDFLSDHNALLVFFKLWKKSPTS